MIPGKMLGKAANVGSAEMFAAAPVNCPPDPAEAKSASPTAKGVKLP